MSEQPESPGWDAIVKAFETLYPGQKEYLHFGTLISWRLGGNDPLEGISIYDGGDFYHFVSLGFSDLFEKENEDPEWSGYGFELTMKLKKNPSIDDDELKTAAGVFQSLARYVFESGAIFYPNEYIYTGQETGMDSRGESKITGFITAESGLGTIDTPNGKVQFVELVGMTDRELKSVVDKKMTAKDLLEKLPNTYTDFTRDEII